ncbi:glutaredoxin-like protein NrdH [Lapidilactobacillus wuchangensis]|uniref:glutaredoxin-like protein NrdH n=1 Tax=Lapidilactobacillus wuchangensis TaxID=2486001 RepID=UPI000F76ECDA|nr:glutaredoxin-like protein NrdH [Lapidilactobacillus wuchangensis]
MNKIVVYTRNGCMQCRMTKRYLDEHHVDFKEINISESPASADYLREKGFSSVPLVFSEKSEQPIAGFRPAELEKLVG